MDPDDFDAAVRDSIINDLEKTMTYSTSRRESELGDRLATLTAFAGGLGDDELRVLEMVARGLDRGREVYGPLVLATDERDFGAEAFEEIRDALVYVAAAMLRRGLIR